MKTTTDKTIRYFLFLLIALSAQHAGAQGWRVLSGNWNDPGNWWTNTVPTSSDTAVIQNGGTALVPSGVSGTAWEIDMDYSSSLNINGGSLSCSLGYIGYSEPGATATVSGGTWSITNELVVAHNTTGSLTINGGTVSGSSASIGYLAGSNGMATVTSGTWNTSNTLYVANSGTGSLTINGGVVSDGNAAIGMFPTANGRATVSGGTWSITGNLDVGFGSLTINGGTVNDNGGFIGSGTSSSTATITSGSWINTGGGVTNVVALAVDGKGTATLNVIGGLVSVPNSYLEVGWYDTGTMNVSGGTVTDAFAKIGRFSGAKGTATISGGKWITTSKDLYVGQSGTGTLNVTGTGMVSVGSGTGTVTLAIDGGSAGTLNLGTGGAAGTLNAAIVTGGGGAAVVNFNLTGSNTFAPKLTGTMTVNKLGSGTVTLTGSNSYTGATNVNVGKLVFANSQKLTALNIASSGTAVLQAHTGGKSNVKVLDISSLSLNGTTAFTALPEISGNSPEPVPETGVIALLAVGAMGLRACKRIGLLS